MPACFRVPAQLMSQTSVPPGSHQVTNEPKQKNSNRCSVLHWKCHWVHLLQPVIALRTLQGFFLLSALSSSGPPSCVNDNINKQRKNNYKKEYLHEGITTSHYVFRKTGHYLTLSLSFPTCLPKYCQELNWNTKCRKRKKKQRLKYLLPFLLSS